jgi:hypothetical protein
MQRGHLTEDDEHKLVSLYLVANRYLFLDHANFAKELLEQHYEKSDDAGYFMTCDIDRLQSAMRIAARGEAAEEDSEFYQLLMKAWLHRIEGGGEPSSCAFDFAEALGLRRFLGELYYLELKKIEPERVEGSSAYAHPVINLPPHRKLALYQGSWSLRYYWAEARREAMNKRFICAHRDQHACQRVWSECWATADLSMYETPIPSFDPRRELIWVANKLPLLVNNRKDCASDTIEDMIDELKDNLADHFLGPVRETNPIQFPV